MSPFVLTPAVARALLVAGAIAAGVAVIQYPALGLAALGALVVSFARDTRL